MQIILLFLSFRGRIGRLPFFVGSTAVGLISTVAFAMLGIDPLAIKADLANFPVLPVLAVFLVSAWPMLALTVKRFHDLDMSGSWAALPIVSLLISLLVLALTFGGGNAGNVQLLGLSGVLMLVNMGISAVSVWNLRKLFFVDGSPAENRFGPRFHNGNLFSAGADAVDVVPDWADKAIAIAETSSEPLGKQTAPITRQKMMPGWQSAASAPRVAFGLRR